MKKQEAYDEIKKIVIRMDPEDGTTLSENYFAQKLEVSRTPVRQALMQLQYEGLITILSQRGIVIKKLSYEEAWQLCDLRRIVEDFLIKQSVKLLDESDFSYLDKAILQQKQLLEERRYEDFLDADEDFHLFIYRHYNNEPMKNIVKNFKDRFYRARLARIKIPGRDSVVIAAHSQIVQLLKEKKVEEASRVIMEHVHGIENDILPKRQNFLSFV